jgi:cyanophycin synthetase
VRLVEIRTLEGPNLYALAPLVKVEVAVGRHHAWTGDREGGGPGRSRLGATAAPAAWPPEVARLVAWLRRLARTLPAPGPTHVRPRIRVHRGSDPGHWVVVVPWIGAERGRVLAEAAVDLAGRRIPPEPGAALSPPQVRRLASHVAAIAAARASPPSWIRDAERRVPIVSISGTNGKSTVTRLVTHILALAGRRVGSTTSDGVYVQERLVDAGDWTGPGGAARILRREDVDVAVLETARGGILLRGVGYESNDVSVLTNVSPDHLDLQGIHTLPELAEAKSTICRITRPSGRVVLDADDPLVAAVARRVRAPVALFTLGAGRTAAIRRHLDRGGIAYAIRGDALVELDAAVERRIVEVRAVPIAIGGIAAYNVANALAAAGAARGLGLGIEAVAAGLRDFRPSADLSPGRLNLFRLGPTLAIVDFAHNEAGVAAVLHVAEGLAAGRAGRIAPVTAIVGTAGDRPDDTLRAIGRVAAEHADRLAFKETPRYLRGRERADVIRLLAEGAAGAGRDPAAIPVYESETAALRAELARPASGASPHPGARVVVLLCHEQRDAVFQLLEELGARPVDVAAELPMLAPRLRTPPAG